MTGSDHWDRSAAAWIAEMGDQGDWGRRAVLDPVMMRCVAAGGFRRALDVGCGEGRFCRQLRVLGIDAIGIDPTAALLAAARHKDPLGDYRTGVGERIDFGDGSFDLVTSYLSLIDIEDYEAAIAEMSRVLAPGGTLLVANLASFKTAGVDDGWEPRGAGVPRHFKIDDYLRTRPSLESWNGIEVINWHRPLAAYMQSFLAHGLTLAFFDEPVPLDDGSAKAARYRRIPWYVVMAWQKLPR